VLRSFKICVLKGDQTQFSMRRNNEKSHTLQLLSIYDPILTKWVKKIVAATVLRSSSVTGQFRPNQPRE
jgi:hypothetical protein